MSRFAICFLFAALCVSGWSSAQAPNKRTADNAAALYSLALEEFERGLPGGFELKSSFPGMGARALTNGEVLVIVDGKVLIDGEAEQKGREAVEKTVLARSLFAQAATRSRCVFQAASPKERDHRRQALLQLRELVRFDAQLQLEEDPQAACEGACTLLHFCHQQSAVIQLGEVEALMRAEKNALDLLRLGLEALRGERRWRELRGRYAAILDQHLARRFRGHDVKAAILKEVVDVVELHRPRLRDMHMHVEGGFDQNKMVARLHEIFLQCMAGQENSEPSLAKRLATIELRLRKTLPSPLPSASVREKATYGMAQLILPQGIVIDAQDREVVAAIKRCQAVLAKERRR